jgi:NADH-quinone oxidoreductase subunit H
VVVCALLGVMPFGQYLVAAQIDVGILFVAVATALVAAALLSSSSPWQGLRAALHIAWQHVPAAVAVVSVVLTTGSLRVQEIERAQGGWPWDWLAFRSPAGLVALVALVAAAVLEPDAPERLAGVAAHIDDPVATAPSRGRGPWLAAACRAHRLVIAGLASVLLLGGWVLPGLSPAAQAGRPTLELLGAAWLLGKAWSLVALLAWARSALGWRTLAERSKRTATAYAPLSIAAVLATAAWTWWSPTGPVQLLVSAILVAAAALGAATLVQRLMGGLAPSQAAHATRAAESLSPFL